MPPFSSLSHGGTVLELLGEQIGVQYEDSLCSPQPNHILVGVVPPGAITPHKLGYFCNHVIRVLLRS